MQKTYDGKTLVVRQLDLDIRRGEFLTLLGPSGSGKTTCLMMLAGFESPTAGEILLDGQPITRTPPHKRNFGMVFQNYALFPHLSVADNVAYPLTVRKVPKAELAQRVTKALAMVRLEGRDRAYPSQLSGGQQQRVALARALVFDPQLVLMDEPLGALDKQLREHMQIELKELHRQLGVTFVYVTHDQGEALTMSDRVAVFNDGAIQQIDTVDRLYETPANRFVAGFVGDSTVLKGTVGTTDAQRADLVLPTGERLAGVNVNGALPGSARGGGRAARAHRGAHRTARRHRQHSEGRRQRRDLFRRPPSPALRPRRPAPGHRQAASCRAARSPWPARRLVAIPETATCASTPERKFPLVPQPKETSDEKDPPHRQPGRDSSRCPRWRRAS